MNKKRAKALVATIFIIAPVVLSGSLLADGYSRGTLIGFVFDKDGIAPVEGVVFKARNVFTGEMLESAATDAQGVFRVEGIASGIYDYVVVSSAGDFAAASNFGLKIREGEQEMLSIKLNPFDRKAESIPKTFPPPVEIQDAHYVGRILAFYQTNSMAEVYIEKGMLRRKDLVKIIGEKTDFDMKVDELVTEKEKEVKALTEGQVGFLKLRKDALPGDAIYISKGDGLLPLFLAVGASAISTVGTVVFGAADTVAGTSGVIFDIPELKEECEPVSPFK